MTQEAKIITDSISPDGIRLTTFQLRYSKFIHGEFMTHRVFSRNASSSRAIPVERMIEEVLHDPVIPSFWGKNQPGMSAAKEWNAGILVRVPGMPGYAADPRSREEVWLMARDQAVEVAKEYARAGYHKQIVNRLLEPWVHIRVVATGTEWANFFALRCHPAAQPEMRDLAVKMRAALFLSNPTFLEPGSWHLPYIDEITEDLVDRVSFHEHEIQDRLRKISVARCARVSYLTHEGKAPNIEDDLRLYDRLVGAVPLHASPAEHQATPDERHQSLEVSYHYDWENPHQHGNFVGWRQYRKMLPNEAARDR